MTAAAEKRPAARRRVTGSLNRRMIGIAGVWIGALLLIGGFALDRVLSRSIVDSFDNQLVFVLNSMIASSEIGPIGEVRFNRPLGDQRFLEPYSGLYWQVSGHAHEPFRSRSLWDRALRQGDLHHGRTLHVADSDEFDGEPLRVLDREVRLPASTTEWRFQVAANRDALNDQIVRELLSDQIVRHAISADEGPADITDRLGLILLSRSLERIADQATNVCEEVIYMVKGADVRHKHV